MLKCDLVVIGAGPGGYPAAIRAAQLGKKVIIVDKGSIGGECLNWGCIPSKALISASKTFHMIKYESKKMGITTKEVSVDIGKLQKWKEGIIRRLVNGIKQLLKSHKVELIIGEASFNNRRELSVTLEDNKKEKITFEKAIIATGASFISIPGFKIDEKDVLSAKGVLSLNSLPEHLVCIGGGVIGLELGTVYAKLGSKVTIIELLPDLMTGVDKNLVKLVRKKLKNLGVKVYTKTKASEVKKVKDQLEISIENEKGKETITADKILLSIGKKASTSNIGLDKVGVKTDNRGFIQVNSKQQTNVNNIFAIGDCTGMPFFAHRATKQGIIAAEVISGLSSEYDFKAVPSVIFTDPEIAFAGLSEEQAKQEGIKVHTASAPFLASGRAMSQLETDGFVKVISDFNDGVLLGIEIVGPHASDLISEAMLALEMGATVEDIGYTMHPHPTLPEMIMEAAEAAEGKAIHVSNPKKK